MKPFAVSGRRDFFKTLAASGLVYSGISGMARAGTLTPDRDVKLKHWDVIVVGGGPGGVPAAVSAARSGLRVLLVERYGFLGGMATTALVHPYMKYTAGGKVIIRGLFEEFVDRLAAAGAILPDRQHFDAEPMKWLLDRFVLEAGAGLLLHTQAIGVLKKGAAVKAVRVFHKGGIEDLSADLFIDSTGDGDLAAWGGAEIKIGRESDGGFQPMTMSFRMAGVDVTAIPDNATINRLYDEAKARGEVVNPRENVLWFKSVHPDVIHFNTTRVVARSALDGWESSDAEIEGRRQVRDMVEFLKKRIRGFENAYLMKIGPQIGVRESRRVMGHYLLTADDVLSARHFDDGIACASYMIDIHNPAGSGTEIRRLKEGTYYQIPYRCLVPKGLDNLLVASRCISADHAAHSSLRVQPIIWAVGQAAGTAAALCLRDECAPSQLDAALLRRTLIEGGAYL